MSNRWQGRRSDFPWEEDALKFLRDRMPESEPYRAWQTFSFTAPSGHVREVDLLMATPSGLYLIEIKSHPGRAVNSGGTWLFASDQTRSIENPLHLTDLKCKELKQRLEWARKELKLSIKVPYIAPAVFLSAPDVVCRFDDVQKANVYGRDGLEQQTHLPGIWNSLLKGYGRSSPDMVAASKQLQKLLDHIGTSGLRRHRKVGPFELAPKAFDAGPTWEDYLAENKAMPGDRRRIRVYLSELKATREERESTRRAARREYLALQGISHEGIVQAEQFSDEHDAGPCVIFRHRDDWRRLDHFLAENPRLEIETRVEMVRQLGEAVDHAHRRHLYHRALAARSIWVELDGRYPRLKIADWQVSSRPGTSATTSHGNHLEGSSGPYLAPEFGNADAEPTLMDVFGLGAVAHLILTGAPPADSRKGLAARLAAERGLVPSVLSDDMSPAMDLLVKGATGPQPVDRFTSVREFLDGLELVEDELTRAETPDLLEAGRGAIVQGWRVEKVLGKGSTAKALLVTKDGHEQVLKVALNEAGRERLAHEAAQLRNLREPRIVRLIDGPLDVGDRTVIVLELAGQRTLAQHLKHDGALTIDDLGNLGGDLFKAVEYLADERVWHRDIKPDNLAIREKDRKGRRLVLFDFSLAGADDQHTEVGTPPYLDPFLGSDRRPVYDEAAELYAVAVTLHEMASRERPSWGDGVVEPNLLPASEQLPQLAEDSFDPLIRDRLTRFFQTALRRDPAERFTSVKQMAQAWSDVFRDLDVPEAQPEQKTAGTVSETTLLIATGLSVRARSVALQQLEASTVGDLVRIPAARIQRLRGVGIGTRNELVRQAREWRLLLQVSEQPGVVARAADPGADLARLSLDAVAAQLVPKGRETSEVRVARLVLALPDAESRPSPVPAWASSSDIAEATGFRRSDVVRLIGQARERWIKSVRPVTALRATVLRLLAAHGRVMEARQLAAALLADRGSALDDPAARLALAEACVRAAVETEEQLDNPRLARRRNGSRTLIASVAEDDPTAPSEEELLDYAAALGEKADELVDLGRDEPLPGASVVRAALSAVELPEGMAPLSVADVIALAAGASENAAMTARLELYPRSLDARRALVLSQVAGYLGEPGIRPEELRDRVLARFPELASLPGAPALRRILKDELGHKVEVKPDGRYFVPASGTQVHSPSYTGLAPTRTRVTASDEATQRLIASTVSGGFLTVKVLVDEADHTRQHLVGFENVRAFSLTDLFVTTLRGIVDERGKPRWETVLAADTPDAPPPARQGFGRLVTEVWSRLETDLRKAAPAGSATAVLLYDATPLARYPGGEEFLIRLARDARDPSEAPHSLWLLCPMEDHQGGHPRIDALVVGVLGENEQLALPRGYAAAPARSAK